MASGYVVAWLDADVDSSSSSSSATRQAQPTPSSSTANRGNARLVLPLPRPDGAAALNLEIVHADPHVVASARIPLSADAREGGKVVLREPVDPGYAGATRGVLEVELRVRYHQLDDTPLPAAAAAPAPKPTPAPTPTPPQAVAAPTPTPAPKPTPKVIPPMPPVPVPSSSATATARAAAAAAGPASGPRPSLISEAALDRIIGTLSEMGAPPTPNQPQHNMPSLALSHLVSESDIRKLCAAAKEIFLRQPMLLDLKPPIKICGDIHGQLDDLVTLFGGGVLHHPSDANYLFLGNYVDFGPNSIETICLLLAYKIKFPDNLHLLRGSHESFTENKRHGFLDDCTRLYNSAEIWKDFNELFKCLPVAALVDGKMFCVHGGLSPELDNVDQIRRIPRPTNVPEVGLLRDLLWSNPAPDADLKGWKVNKNDGGSGTRSSSYAFGADVVGDFLKKNNLKLICRGHQAVERGYHFFANRRQLVTIFSAANFRDMHGNAGAVMSVVPRSLAVPAAKEDSNRPRHERPVYLDESVAYSFKLQLKPA